ncbi:amidohydrolase [Roseiarcaceae bacterium H3SJ34-1]|uniref:amidohydrolase n=1 Tax=Terripilifer ovatus TaxID=3032367 RepID=UPI003AB9372E|nr:amidohydrolase [Roseiarcaceae bacterium H3SJ34-1]
MHHIHSSRRDFLGMTAGALGGASIPWRLAFADARDADMVVINATVHTVDASLPRAEAFAVRDGRFLAVGSSDDVKSFAGKATQVVDAKGLTIVPGFIDCHVHPVGEVLLYQVLVGNPFDVEFVTIDSIIAKLRERAAQTPPGTWVEGFFFDDTKVKDAQLLTVRDLDKASTQHPIMVRHRGGHTYYVNSKAFELAGITRETPNPFGGTFDRDQEGNLNGRVTDRAGVVFTKVGQRPVFTEAQRAQRSRDGLAHISKQFVRYGLTSVHHEGGDLAALQQIRARGDLLHRVSYEAAGPLVDSLIADGFRSGFGDEWLRIGATFEHTIDGSFSERTMALSTPYAGSNPPYKGNILTTQDDLNAWIEKVHRAGIQVNCHANGDVAIDMMLTAMERALKLHPVADARPKITHCTLINDDLIARMKAMNAVAAVFSTYPYYNSDKFVFYGEDLLKRSMALRTMIDAGLRPAAGSDFSPGPFSPLLALQAMVTRTGWDGKTWGANQRISIDEALMVTTLNGAYNSHEEAIKGSITPGKLADYVVLAEDVKTVAPDKIKDIKIVRTVTGGVTRYEA